MAKSVGFLLGCLRGLEEGPKAVDSHAAAMGLWNLSLDPEGRAAVEENGEALPAVIDIVVRGHTPEAVTPCIGCLEALSLSPEEETKGLIQRAVGSLVGRFESYAQEHSHAETVAIYGILANLSRGRRPAALAIADRMLKAEMLRALRNWVDHDLQAACVVFLEAASTCNELHGRLLELFPMALAVRIMEARTNKRASHAALGYLGGLAGSDGHREEVHRLLCTEKSAAAMEWLAKVGTEALRVNVARVLWRLVREPQRVKVFRAVVPNLVPLLASEEEAVVEAVTATLWFMTYDDPVCMSIGAARGVPALVRHAQAKHHRIRMQATGVLRNMAQHETLLKMMITAGCPAHLVNLWKPIDVRADLPADPRARPKFPAISASLL